MNLNKHEQRVLDFFTAHSGTCVSDLERAQKLEDFIDASEYRNFCKTTHSAANALYNAGLLTRDLRLDIVNNKEVWHYYLPAAPEAPRTKTEKGYKAKYEKLLEEMKEKDDQIETLILMKERLEGEVAILKLRLNQ